jgi:ATP-dependent DNA helicase PIF1
MLREVVRMLKSEGRRVSITAPTGIAALAIGGCTIHSWAKVGLGHGSVHTLYNNHMTFNMKAKKFVLQPHPDNILTTDVLIVDEISMVRVVNPQTL